MLSDEEVDGSMQNVQCTLIENDELGYDGNQR